MLKNDYYEVLLTSTLALHFFFLFITYVLHAQVWKLISYLYPFKGWLLTTDILLYPLSQIKTPTWYWRYLNIYHLYYIDHVDFLHFILHTSKSAAPWYSRMAYWCPIYRVWAPHYNLCFLDDLGSILCRQFLQYTFCLCVCAGAVHGKIIKYTKEIKKMTRTKWKIDDRWELCNELNVDDLEKPIDLVCFLNYFSQEQLIQNLSWFKDDLYFIQIN